MFSMRDALLFLNNAMLSWNTNLGIEQQSTDQVFLPQLVVVDGQTLDSEKIIETLMKLREFDVKRTSMVVSLVLPKDGSNATQLKDFFEAGADIFSQSKLSSFTVGQ